MNLYLVRHGDALDHAEDEKRELSPQGREQARALGRFLKRNGVHFTAAHTSPLLRARQTTETILAVTNEAESLAPDFAGAMLNSTTLDDFHDWLGQLRGENILLVGHEPSLSERVRSLLSIASPDAFTMKKGACACVQSRDERNGVLLFHVTPKQLQD